GIGLSSDGANGVVMLPITTGNRSQYMHYNGSSWTTLNGPARSGTVQATDADWRPGTTAVVSAGTASEPSKKNPLIEHFSRPSRRTRPPRTPPTEAGASPFAPCARPGGRQSVQNVRIAPLGVAKRGTAVGSSTTSTPGGRPMDIISRAKWGARAPRSRSTVSWSQRREFIVHYSEGPTTQSVRSIQD